MNRAKSGPRMFPRRTPNAIVNTILLWLLLCLLLCLLTLTGGGWRGGALKTGGELCVLSSILSSSIISSSTLSDLLTPAVALAAPPNPNSSEAKSTGSSGVKGSQNTLKQGASSQPPSSQPPSSQPPSSAGIALQPGQPCHRAGHAGSSPLEISHILAADAGQVISIAKSGDVCLWQGLKSTFIGSLPDNFSAVALDPVSRRLAIAVGQQVSILSLQDLSDEEPSTQRLRTISEIKRIGTGVSSLDFHPDGESLLIGGLDGKIYRWRLTPAEAGLLQIERAENLERYFGHSAVISALAMHSFGNIFLSGDWNGVLSIWALYDADAAKGQFDSDLMPGKYFSDAADRIKVERDLSDEIIAIKISLDGEIFALATAGGTIEVWKVRGVKKLATVQAHKGEILAFDLDRSGRNLLSLGRDGLLKRWKLVNASAGDKTAGIAENVVAENIGADNIGADNIIAENVVGDKKEEPSEMLLKLISANSDRGFSSAAFDVSGKVVVGGRDGQVLRQR